MRNLSLLALSAVTGIFAGLAASLFLHGLNWVTATREQNPWLFLGLPIVGVLIAKLYLNFGRNAGPGTHLIIDEIHSPRARVPLRMAPLIFVSTLLTHLCGGSAGREGTVVQMGASLADQLQRVFNIDKRTRKILLQAGAGAGFGAALGTPWAGAVFGIEFISRKLDPRVPLRTLFSVSCASLVAYLTSLVLAAPHTHYPIPRLHGLNGWVIVAVPLSGVAYGLTARAFLITTHALERQMARWLARPVLRSFVGGSVLALAFLAFPELRRYAGLGLPIIQQGLTDSLPIYDFALKALLTSLTLSSGFKGGEFIPLVYVGTALGRTLGDWFVPSVAVANLITTAGFGSVFAAASRTPFACSLMVGELFGWPSGLAALVAGQIAKSICGTQGLYSGQR